MLLWFVGLSPLLVWVVFRSPALDLRVVMLGAALPLVEAVLGGPKLLHTLTGAVGLLTVIMLATRSRRLLRRRLLGIPIGLMLHLVLDGTWANTELFWWPFFGWGFGDEQVPELTRSVPVLLVMELVGAAALVFGARLFGLEDPTRRAEFLRTGRVSAPE